MPNPTTHAPTLEQVASGDDAWIGRVFGPRLIRLQPGATADHALRAAGLDWNVIQRPLLVDHGHATTPVTSHVANLRDDYCTTLGIVGASYEPVHNRDALRVAEAIIDASGADWVGVAQTHGGARTHAVLRLPREVRIAGDEDEAILPLLHVRNAHDGSSALSVAVCPYRVVCSNGMALPLPGAERTWRVRHTANATSRIAEARRALGTTWRYLDRLDEIGQRLISAPLSDTEFEHFARSLLPVDRQASAPAGQRRYARVMEQRIALQTAREAPDARAIRGTRWGALQAVTRYASHSQPLRAGSADRTFTRATEPAALSARALHLLSA